MKQLLIFILTTGALSAWAVPKLDCGPAAAQKLIEAMPDMGASSYAPERYGFLRSTCGTAENGDYCLGRDMENSLQDPVYDEAAASYAEGLRLCGVTANTQGRLQTGEIRCRPDPQPTCRIFAPDASNHANWGRSVTTESAPTPTPTPQPDAEVVPEATSRPEAVEQEPQPSRLDRAGRVVSQGGRVVGRGIVQGSRLAWRGIQGTGNWISRQIKNRRNQREDSEDEEEVEEEETEEDQEPAEQPEEDWGEGW